MLVALVLVVSPYRREMRTLLWRFIRRAPRLVNILRPERDSNGDLPLRRSYRGRWPTAAFLVSCGLAGTGHRVGVPGFCLVRARGGHGSGSSPPWCSSPLGYEPFVPRIAG